MKTLGRYELLGELGRGAMGIVYRAHDPLLGRVVAIKTIGLTADAEERAEYERRFYQEARAAGSLNHPGIVTLHDLGRVDDVVYMAMELVEGHELRDELGTGQALPVGRAADIAAQVADALAYAHARGVVHRDVKPGNVMLIADGRVKIMDFGIARVEASEIKTQTGMMLGSPKYMSPEQVLGRPADARSDIFALGVMFHEMLTGIPPFEGADVPALMYAVVHHPAPAPSAINGNVPPVLDLIVAKALAKAPEERYADAAEMARDLRSAIAAPPTATAPSVATVGAEKTLPLRDTMRPAPQATSRAPLVPPVAATSGLAKAFDSSLAFERLREGSARGLQPRVPSTARRAYTGRERLVLGVGVTLAVLVALGIAAH